MRHEVTSRVSVCAPSQERVVRIQHPHASLFSMQSEKLNDSTMENSVCTLGGPFVASSPPTLLVVVVAAIRYVALLVVRTATHLTTCCSNITFLACQTLFSNLHAHIMPGGYSIDPHVKNQTTFSHTWWQHGDLLLFGCVHLSGVTTRWRRALDLNW